MFNQDTGVNGCDCSGNSCYFDSNCTCLPGYRGIFCNKCKSKHNVKFKEKKIHFLSLSLKDDICWNDPCKEEGICVAINETGFECTCGIKFGDSKCQSSKFTVLYN